MYDSDEESKDAIACINCGSSNFYRDDATDSLICNDCYTQSQSQSQRETTDHEEVMAVAATTKGGGLIRTKRFRSNFSSSDSTRGRRDEELDKSQPLPSLVDCCNAFQVLLKLAAERAALFASPISVEAVEDESKISATNDESDDDDESSNSSSSSSSSRSSNSISHQERQAKFQQAVVSIAGEIWFAYLNSWQNSAEYFSQMFPELRFSLRDYFLNKNIRIMLVRYLSAKALDEIRIGEMEHNENSAGDGKVTLNILEDYNNKSNKINSVNTRRKKRMRVAWKDELHKIQNDDDDDEQYQQLPQSSNRNTKQYHEDSDDNLENDLNAEDDCKDDKDPTYINHKDDDNIDKNNSHTQTQSMYKYRSPFLTVKTMLKQMDGCRNLDKDKLDNHHATLQLTPSLNLLTAIVYLALLKLRTGISSHHFVSLASNGSYPYLMHAYNYLPKQIKEKIGPCCDRMFKCDTIPKPATLDYLVDLLISSLDSRVMERSKDNVYITRQMKHFRNFKKEELKAYLGPNKTEKNKNDKSSKNDKKSLSRSISKNQCKDEDIEGSDNDEFSQDILENINSSHLTSRGTLTQLSPSPTKDNETSKKISSPSMNDFYQDNIPLMAYRFVTDLGLNQRVLDITLALIGFKVSSRNQPNKKRDDDDDDDTNSFIPAPLNNASADKIVSPAHLIAVIVVACKMCHGWEKWGVHLSPTVMFRNRKEAAKVTNDISKESVDSDEDSALDEIKFSKDFSITTQQRFIPWTENDIHLIGNGNMLKDYFGFIEDTFGSEMSSSRRYNEVLSLIKKNLKSASEDKLQTKSAIRANSTIAGGRNPNIPQKVKHKGRYFYYFLKHRSSGAVWVDANGVGEYIIYKDIRSHTRTTRGATSQLADEGTTIEPFHPHYGLLIEYISDKLYVEPAELHYLVSCIDEEISHYHVPQLDWSLQRNSGFSMMSSEGLE